MNFTYHVSIINFDFFIKIMHRVCKYKCTQDTFKVNLFLLRKFKKIERNFAIITKEKSCISSCLSSVLNFDLKMSITENNFTLELYV